MLNSRLLVLFVALSGFCGIDQSNGSERTTVDLLQQYVRINTSNPPGMEIEGARLFADIFEAKGIAYEIAESAPGRANIWARLEGGDKPGV